MKKILLSLLLILCIIGCAKDEPWKYWYGPWTDIATKEYLRISSIMDNQKFVFYKITNDRGDDLLAGEYACLADDTFHFTNEWEQWVFPGGAIVKISQGVRHCVDNSDSIIISAWGIHDDGYVTKDGNTDLAIPYPFESSYYINDTTDHHYYYTPLWFNKFHLDKSYYTLDSTGILSLFRRRDNDWQYFYLKKLD